MGQVGVQAVDVHVKDVEIGVTAVVDEMAEVPVVGSVHLKRRRGIIFKPVFRIRKSFHADPDPGSQKCPYGSGSRPLFFIRIRIQGG